MVVIKRQDSAKLVSALAVAAYANDALLKSIFEPCGEHETTLMSPFKSTATNFTEPTLRRLFFCTVFTRVLRDASQDEHGNLKLEARFLRTRTLKEIEATLPNGMVLRKARTELIQRFMGLALPLFAETVSPALKRDMQADARDR